MRRPWRRRNYFVKRDTQGRVLFIAFVFAVTELVIFALLLGWSQAEKFTVSYEDRGLRVQSAPAALLEQVLGAQWVLIVAGGLLVALVALFLSHRFAGPMYRLEETLRQMIRGNFGETVRLRARDEGKDLAELLNRFNTEMSSAMAEMGEAVEVVRLNLCEALDRTDPAAVRDSVANAERAAHRLGAILNRYRQNTG